MRLAIGKSVIGRVRQHGTAAPFEFVKNEDQQHEGNDQGSSTCQAARRTKKPARLTPDGFDLGCGDKQPPKSNDLAVFRLASRDRLLKYDTFTEIQDKVERQAMTQNSKPLSLEDIENSDLVAWMREQLAGIRDFLVDHEADEEMLSAIDQAMEDNELWSDPTTKADFQRPAYYPVHASGPIPTFASRLYRQFRQMSESKDH